MPSSSSSTTIPQNNVVLLAISLFVIVPLLVLGVVFVILPVYTLSLAVITSLRAEWRTIKTRKMQKEKDGGDHLGGRAARDSGSGSSNAWDGIVTSFFRGTVYHVRHRPAVHAFEYPLYFAVVDLDEATLLFGRDRVASAAVTYHPANIIMRPDYSDRRGLLWPLNTLMLLRDSDHLKNGEGLTTTTTTTTTSSCPPCNEVRLSMRERIMNLLHERTCGKLNLLQPKESGGGRRRIVLVTHLMYYGYCFNPVSFFFIMKPTSSSTSTTNDEDDDDDDDDDKMNNKEEEEDELEAIVVEVSNTPWNEMYVYVLHPDSIDIIDYSTSATTATATTTATTKQKQHRYRWRKAFHVSPFMTMDYMYDWKFVITGKDCISVEAKMIRQCPATTNHDDTLSSSASSAAAAAAATISDKGVINKEDNDKDDNESNSRLYFTAGFTIHRTTSNNDPIYYYPIELALIIIRYPMYCILIQLWIHYEAVQLLLRKNVQFIPHPLGSTTFVSTMIEVGMIPIYAIVKCFDKNYNKVLLDDKKKK